MKSTDDKSNCLKNSRGATRDLTVQFKQFKLQQLQPKVEPTKNR